MGIDAKGLVLMGRENGILSHELGSYNVLDGMTLIFKAYVEEGKVRLFVTTDENIDITDEEYNRIFDEYDPEALEARGIEFEEVDDEVNPVWCLTFDYSEEHAEIQETINFALNCHKEQLQRIFESLRA